MPQDYTTQDVLRFKKHIKVAPSGCHEWQGHIMRNGYGQFNVNGKVQLTHRVSYEMSNGCIPQGMYVLHRCDNPACCNPEHLFVGTQADNMRDAKLKGRSRSPLIDNPRIGKLNVNAKMTDELVARARSMYATGGYSQPQLARMFGVSKASMNSLLLRKTWAHVP